MPASDDLKFNVVDSALTPPLERWVRGTDITFGSATAQGLLKVGNIDIDAQDPIASSVDMGNTAGPGFTLQVHGSEIIDNNLTVTVDASLKGYAFCNSLVAKHNSVTGFGFLFDGTPTAARTITYPDDSGTVPLLNRPQWWSAKQTFNAGVTLIHGNLAVSDGGSATLFVESDTQRLAFFNVAPVSQRPATTAVPATPTFVGTDTVNLAEIVSQMAALRTTVEELRARLTSYGLTP